MTILRGVQARLRASRLLWTTDLRGDDLGPVAQRAFGGGVNLIQVAAPDADRAAVKRALELVRAVSYDYQGLVVVSHDADLAAEFSADALLLGSTGPDAATARRRLPQASVVGRSCHSVEQVRAAIADEAVDFFTVGPVFATSATPRYDAPGLDLVREAAALSAGENAKPWFAVGGIDADRLGEVIDAGARKVGVTGAIGRADDPRAVATALADRLRQAPGAGWSTAR